jgi:hypothetical protein
MTTRLDNWVIINDHLDPFKAPEQCVIQFEGEVSGHNRFEDGTPVRTSAMQGLHMRGDELILETEKTIYVLGEPHEEYESAYPESKARLIDRAVK